MLRLLVKDILIGPGKITIRHRIPARSDGSATRQYHAETDTEGDQRASCPLRWGRGFTRHVQRLLAPARPGVGRRRRGRLPATGSGNRQSRLLRPAKWIVQDVNRFLGGWAAFFRFGNAAARFEKIRNYARMRLALFIAKRHRRSREFGWSVITCQSPNQLGLVTLSGTSSTPGPSGTGGLGRMPAVNGVGEACAGKPHARWPPRADPCKAGPRRGYRAQAPGESMIPVPARRSPAGEDGGHQPSPSLDRRLLPRRLAVSAGSARWAVILACRSSSTT